MYFLSYKSGYLPSGADCRLICRSHSSVKQSFTRKGLLCANEHRKCFILPMHRLGCCRDCCILCRHSSVQYLMRFFFFFFVLCVFTSLLPLPSASTCFTPGGGIGGGSKTILYWLLQEVWMNLSDCVCEWVCVLDAVLFFFFPFVF